MWSYWSKLNIIIYESSIPLYYNGIKASQLFILCDIDKVSTMACPEMRTDILVGRRGQPSYVIPCILLNVWFLQVVVLQWLWNISSVYVISVHEVSHIYKHPSHIWPYIQCSVYWVNQHQWYLAWFVSCGYPIQISKLSSVLPCHYWRTIKNAVNYSACWYTIKLYWWQILFISWTAFFVTYILHKTVVLFSHLF